MVQSAESLQATSLKTIPRVNRSQLTQGVASSTTRPEPRLPALVSRRRQYRARFPPIPSPPSLLHQSRRSWINGTIRATTRHRRSHHPETEPVEGAPPPIGTALPLSMRGGATCAAGCSEDDWF